MANKPPLWNTPYGRFRITCCYCKRVLQDHNARGSDYLTFDHVRAESGGGWKTVPCCIVCNRLKDDLPAEDWFWFISTHPRWWREFTVPSQVRRVVREFRFEQAKQGANDIEPFRRGPAELPKIGWHHLR